MGGLFLFYCSFMFLYIMAVTFNKSIISVGFKVLSIWKLGK